MKRKIYSQLIFIIAIILGAGNILAQNPGNALDFDGSDDYVTIPDAAALDITDQITLEGWIKSSSGSWIYKKTVTVDYTKVSATLSNFPVLVSVTDTDLLDSNNGGVIQPDGDDILFKSLTGTTYPHEIEEYDGSTGYLRAWVKVPTLSSVADTEFYIYYGNSSCSSQQDVDNVWDSNYQAVWHLEESGNGTVDEFKDDSGNNNHGRGGGGVSSNVPAQSSSGKVGNAQNFDGNDYISMGDVLDYGKNDTMTYSAWIKTSSTWMQIAGKADESSWQGVWFYIEEGSELSFQLYDASANGKYRISTETFDDNQWHYVVATYDGSNSAAGIKLYADGQLLGTSSVSDDVLGTVKNNYPFIIGATNDAAGNPFIGLIDEVRLSSTDHDSSWIGTEFRNQSSPGTFLSLGIQSAAGVSKTGAYAIGVDNTNAHGTINNQTLSGSVNAGEWNHIALTYNKDAGGTDEIKLFINGAQSAAADYSTAITSNSNDLILGDIAGLYGLLDEVRLWNDVRTETEIRENMHRVLTPGSEANLVAYWQFNESSGTSAADSAGSNTGTLSNMTDGDWVSSPAPFGGGLANTNTSFTSGTTDLGTFSLTTTDAFDNAVYITSTEVLNAPNTLPSVEDQLDTRYWIVDVFGTPGTYSTNLTFTIPAGFLEVGNEAYTKLYNRSSNSDGSWTELVSEAASITETTVTFNGVSTLGQFTIGGVTPMPVELSSFSGTFGDEGVTLRWRTETEVNNYGFEIEKNTSDDPSNGVWEVIDFVTGYGNSNSPKSYSYTDSQISSNGIYHYRLRQIDFDGTFEYLPQVDVEVDVSHKFVLHQNYPNPFNPTTKISFDLPVEMKVKVTIYNILGQVVQVLTNDVYQAGEHELVFDGGKLAAGMYCYSLQAGNQRLMGKMLLLK